MIEIEKYWNMDVEKDKSQKAKRPGVYHQVLFAFLSSCYEIL